MELQAQARTVLGKSTKKLRRAGIIPANIYGPGFPSQAVQVSAGDIKQMLHVGAPRQLTLNVAGGNPGGPITVRIAALQREPVYGGVLHIDFIAVGR